MFIIPLLASINLFSIGASIVTICAGIFAFIKWIVLPHIENLLDKKIDPICLDVNSIKTIISRELQPNGTPLATKVAVIEQKIKDMPPVNVQVNSSQISLDKTE